MANPAGRRVRRAWADPVSPDTTHEGEVIADELPPAVDWRRSREAVWPSLDHWSPPEEPARPHGYRKIDFTE